MIRRYRIMEETAEEIVEESDMIQVQEPAQSKDDLVGMGLPEMNLPSMEMDVDLDLGIDF